MVRGRILVIDNDPACRDFFRSLLEEEGYRVETAAGGGEGLQHLYRQSFDLLILDMALKGEDALQVAAAVRHLNPDQEIVAAAGRHEADLAILAMRNGISDYLLKPIDREAFLLLVGKTLFRQSLQREHAKLLDENIDYFSMVASLRRCLELLKITDLDRLADHIADLMMDLLRADGACLWSYREIARCFRLRSVRGLGKVRPDEKVLSFAEVERRKYPLAEPCFEQNARCIIVPVHFGGERIAFLRLEEPSGRECFNRKDLKVAQMVAEFAACGLHNAQLIRSLEQNYLRGPQGGSFNMAFFRDHVDQEISKSRRHRRNLSILKLKVVNYPSLKGEFTDMEVEKILERLVGTVRGSLREGDALAVGRPDEYFLLLGETDFWESLLARRRLRRLLRPPPVPAVHPAKDGAPRVLIRAATFPADGETFAQLDAAAEMRFQRMATSLGADPGIAEAPFWSAMEHVFRGGFRRRVEEQSGRGFRESCFTRVTAETIEVAMGCFCGELIESPRRKGVIYRGCAEFPKALEEGSLVASIEQSAATVYLVGESRQAECFFQRIIPICIPDPAFGAYPFFFYFSEEYAYALISRRLRGDWVGFHTSDHYFVESMIFKLQEQYRLQEPM